MTCKSFDACFRFISLQLVLLTSPIKTALYFLPMIVAGTIFNIIPGYLLGRVKGKTLVVVSLLMSLVSLLPITIVGQSLKMFNLF